MFAKLTLLATALQASLALAGGNAIIKNQCNYDVWVWSVDQSSRSSAIHVPAQSQYSEGFKNACNGCGTSLKVSKTSSLSGGAQTQFEYSIVDNQVWFDISFVDCAAGDKADSCPGHAEGLAMSSPAKACGTAKCAAGSYCPDAAYYVDFPLKKLGLKDPVFTCPGVGMGSMDLAMTLCADDGGKVKRSVAGRLLMDA